MEPDVAQALLPAASPLMGTLLMRHRVTPATRVETSLDTAGKSACATSPLLFGYLLATGSYKFRVLDGCLGARGLAAFGLLGARRRGRRQERGRHVGQFGFLFRRQRLDEVRG